MKGLLGLRPLFATLLTLSLNPLGLAQQPEPIDQVPMYGNIDRTAIPHLREADEKFVEGTTKAYGSRAQAAKAAVDQGFRFYLRDDLVNAMRRFNQAWLLDPGNPQVYWGFGSIRSDQGKMCESMTFLEKALSFNVHVIGLLPDVARSVALCALEDKSLSEADRSARSVRADELYARALEQERDKGYVYASMASVWYHRGEYAKAWQAVDQSRRLGGSPSPAFLAQLRERMQEPAQQ